MAPNRAGAVTMPGSGARTATEKNHRPGVRTESGIRRDVGTVMRRLGKAISGLALPAVEKVAGHREGRPFRVLIATLLSARTQDPVTHAASERLFDAAPSIAAMASMPASRIERLIYPVSFYRTKARHVKETSRLLLERHDGKVPDRIEQLLALPGVGRKTANLVLILAFESRRHICVDTHVHRISNRLGWVSTKSPRDTEEALYRVAGQRWWPEINLHLVTWGQHVCRPVRPRCGSCAIRAWCATGAAAQGSSGAVVATGAIPSRKG
jgi:endonuclease III